MFVTEINSNHLREFSVPSIVPLNLLEYSKEFMIYRVTFGCTAHLSLFSRNFMPSNANLKLLEYSNDCKLLEVSMI